MTIAGLVSTVIPVHNRPRMIVEAVQSVLAQSYRPIEIWVVDDGSTDSTPNVVDDLAKKYDEVTALHIDNGGPGVAREAGRQRCDGEYIQYLDSDDLLLPDKFRAQVAALEQRPECGVCYGQTEYLAAGQTPSGVAWKRTGEKIEYMFPGFVQDRWWGTSTPLYRKRVCDAVGSWQTIRNEEDWEYDCRIAALGTRLAYCNQMISVERGHRGMRQSTDAAYDKNKLANRARARILIWESAEKACLDRALPEVAWFARYAFLLGRQCGEVGLDGESRMMFELAREASTLERRNSADFRAYRACAAFLGWSNTARLAQKLDWFKNWKHSPS